MTGQRVRLSFDAGDHFCRVACDTCTLKMQAWMCRFARLRATTLLARAVRLKSVARRRAKSHIHLLATEVAGGASVVHSVHPSGVNFPERRLQPAVDQPRFHHPEPVIGPSGEKTTLRVPGGTRSAQ